MSKESHFIVDSEHPDFNKVIPKATNYQYQIIARTSVQANVSLLCDLKYKLESINVPVVNQST
jgi:hypothetical protein